MGFIEPNDAQSILFSLMNYLRKIIKNLCELLKVIVNLIFNVFSESLGKMPLLLAVFLSVNLNLKARKGFKILCLPTPWLSPEAIKILVFFNNFTQTL